MNAFKQLKAAFDANWTTVLVGWIGPGGLSPWPDRWTEFPPFISPSEIAAYADERLAVADPKEVRSILELSTIDLQTESREMVRRELLSLSKHDGADSEIELRKWRVILLEQLLESMPQDEVYGLIALTEFWQNFGFPSDSPHVVQGRGNTISPSEYYQQDNLNRLVARHRTWIEHEKAALRKQKAD